MPQRRPARTNSAERAGSEFEVSRSGCTALHILVIFCFDSRNPAVKGGGVMNFHSTKWIAALALVAFGFSLVTSASAARVGRPTTIILVGPPAPLSPP